MATATIALSRQQLRYTKNTPWVSQTIKALEYFKSKKHSLVSTVGTANWNFITTVSQLYEIPVILILAKNQQENVSELKKQFSLNHCVKTVAIENWDTTKNGNKAEFLNERDRTICDSADYIFPISIRKNGMLHKLIDMFPEKVHSRFQCEYDKKIDRLGYTVSVSDADSERLSNGDQWIIHWTRAHNGPWIDETYSSFIKDVLSSETWPRSALRTLERMLANRTILGSSFNMPGKIATVSFTSLSPIESTKLMRWRARYRQMSFEPYGIGIRKVTAEMYGIFPVKYYSDKRTIGENQWLYQSIGTITDWRAEKEFRHRGNFNFSSIPKEDVCVFCYLKTESDYIQQKYGYNATFINET